MAEVVTDATELGQERGDCPSCGLTSRLTTDGRIRWHRRLVRDASPVNRIPPGACEGTGQPPAAALEPARREVDPLTLAACSDPFCAACLGQIAANEQTGGA